MELQCIGITKKGSKCKNIASFPKTNPKVCHLHKDQLPVIFGKKVSAKKVSSKKATTKKITDIPKKILIKKVFPKKILSKEEYETIIHELIERKGELFEVLIQLYRLGLQKSGGSKSQAIEYLKSRFTKDLYDINYPILQKGLQTLLQYIQKYQEANKIKILFYQDQIPQVQKLINILYNLYGNGGGGTSEVANLLDSYEIDISEAIAQFAQMPKVQSSIKETPKKIFGKKQAIKVPIT